MGATSQTLYKKSERCPTKWTSLGKATDDGSCPTCGPNTVRLGYCLHIQQRSQPTSIVRGNQDMMDLITEKIQIASVVLETRIGLERSGLEMFVEDAKAIHRYMDGRASDLNFWESRELVQRYEEIERFMAKYRGHYQD